MNSHQLVDNVQEPDFIDGTSPFEVYVITFFVPLCLLLLSVTLHSYNIPEKCMQLIHTVSANLILLLSLTIFSDYCCTVLLTLLICLVFALFGIYTKISNDRMQHIKKSISDTNFCETFNRKFIGDYRGHLLLATCICILAVDFAFFPERFSKTETYGWSVMDAGVGSFVFIHGLSSSCAKGTTDEKNSFKKCMLSSFPLFTLGIIRLVVTKAVGYHKVIPEYGIHWNFFFTLAFTKVICYVLATSLPFILPGLIALITSIIHQMLLSYSLTKFVLSESRKNLIEANKEGICSLLGFVAIYFYGVQLGQYLWKKRDSLKEYIYILSVMCGLGIFGWIFMYVMHIKIQPVSRRMANMSYCIWVISLTSLQLALHLVHQIINFILSIVLKKDISDYLLWKAVNYNGLFYFLLANIMTGLINLSIKTENCNNLTSFLILTLYLTILTISVLVLYEKSIQLNIWNKKAKIKMK